MYIPPIPEDGFGYCGAHCAYTEGRSDERVIVNPMSTPQKVGEEPLAHGPKHVSQCGL